METSQLSPSKDGEKAFFQRLSKHPIIEVNALKAEKNRRKRKKMVQSARPITQRKEKRRRRRLIYRQSILKDAKEAPEDGWFYRRCFSVFCADKGQTVARKPGGKTFPQSQKVPFIQKPRAGKDGEFLGDEKATAPFPFPLHRRFAARYR